MRDRRVDALGVLDLEHVALLVEQVVLVVQVDAGDTYPANLGFNSSDVLQFSCEALFLV